MTARHNVLVLGGSGFVGRHVVARLVAASHRVTVVTRRIAQGRHLLLLPTVDVVEADPYDLASLTRLAHGMTVAINLVGIIHEAGRQTFERAHVELPRLLVAACRAAGVSRLLHMSALTASEHAPSKYLRSKAAGEKVVTDSSLGWTIFRPSVIFGREDSFLNLFARLLHKLPIVPLAGADARFQPVYVGDVAECFATALELDATIANAYELCGPRQYTLRELVKYVGVVSGAERPIVPLGPGLAKLQALALEMLPGKMMTRDNLASMRCDNVCSGAFPPIFRMTPTTLEAIAPEYLSPEALHSRYDYYRAHVHKYVETRK
ncbi:MAG TPA: complex I NDUFA9 subunit family protein [Casimicrobiaceae bacterium]|nr:complex I NDUFA9 subunit family protein [Casimicrobiaceae bacterium]